MRAEGFLTHRDLVFDDLDHGCGATSKAYAKASSWHLANNYIWTAERKEVLTPSHYEKEYSYKVDRYEDEGGGSYTAT